MNNENSILLSLKRITNNLYLKSILCNWKDGIELHQNFSCDYGY